MRRLALLAAALPVMLAGCAALAPTVTPAPESAPLEARIFPPFFGRVSFTVNKPAYVALFEVVPGQGMSLLYPQTGNSLRVSAGTTWSDLRFVSQRWMYSRNTFASAMGPSRYFFLVASEEPLDLRRFQRTNGLRSHFGFTRFIAMRPFEAMEDLAFAVVPRIDSDRWVADVFSDWGFDWGYGWTGSVFASSSLYRANYCANGSVRYVSWWYLGDPCTGWYPYTLHDLAPGLIGMRPGGVPAQRPPALPPSEGERSRVAEGEGDRDGRTRQQKVVTLESRSATDGRTRLAGELANPLGASGGRFVWDERRHAAFKESVADRQREAWRSRQFGSRGGDRPAFGGGTRSGGVDADRSVGRTRVPRSQGEPRPSASPAPSPAPASTPASSAGSEGRSRTSGESGGGGRSRTP